MVSFDEEDVQTLVKLGLNCSQAKVYLALISLGVANAKEINQTVGIDRGEIYRQLNSLHKKSLVEKILEVPTEYKPIALSEALRILIQTKKNENEEIQQKAKALLKKTGHIYIFKEDEYKISIIPQGDYLKRYILSALGRVQKEYLWYTQIERIPMAMRAYHKEFAKASARGIRFRAIAEISKPTNPTLENIQSYKEKIPNFVIRFVSPALMVTFAIRDGKELDYFTEVAKGLADSQALYTDNPQIVGLVKDYFELRWKTATTEYPKKEQ